VTGLPSIELRVPSPLVELVDERLAASGVRLLLKRDDLIHPELPGNKWRKLKYNLETARAGGHEMLLTFGGAYSNHIRATAAAGYYGGFRTIGVIRGEERLPLNPSLVYATSRGMQLMYLDRTSYRDQRSEEVIAPLRERFGDFFLLPEGGSNADAVRGCAELPAEIEQPFDLLYCAVGTGGTLAGVAAGLEDSQHAVGIPVLKGGQYLSAEVRKLQRVAFGSPTDNWSLDCRFHFGGYAKKTPALDDFIEDFHRRHSLWLDWVYVAKMLYAVFTKVGRGEIDHGKTVVAVISGSDLIPAA
jgi:1-aminocyclopropane-1-carboxylate deaminase